MARGEVIAVKRDLDAMPRGYSRSILGAVLACGLALVLLVAAAPASAATGHSVLRTFSTGPNSGPRGVATDSEGNVYVLDVDARRIDKFDSAGNRSPFAATLGYVNEASISGTTERPFDIAPWAESGIAVDRSGGPDDGHIYFANTDNASFADTFVFDHSGRFLGRLGLHGNYHCAAAVNQATGDFYETNEGAGAFYRFPVPSGSLDLAKPNGQLQLNDHSCTLAVDSAGAVYAGSNPVSKYDPSQFGAAPPVASAQLAVPATALAVDPANGDVYADEGNRLVRFNSAGVQQGAPFGDLSGSRGVTADGNGNVLASDANGGVFVYGPVEVELPTATTNGSTNVTAQSADVEGSVDPDGAGTITGCVVRYGEDSGYSSGSVPCSPGAPIASPTSVTATLTGLVASTTYRYRIFVTNANGTQMASSDQTFTTASALEGVTSAAATEVTKDAATLNGSFTGDGSEVHYFFEWGATSAYGHTTPLPPGASAGSGTGTVNVAPVHISGLHGATTYHYRLVVSNTSGISRGQDEGFTTPDAVTNPTADPPTAVTDTGAELNASFDGDSTYETHYYFEWGPTLRYGNTTSAPPGAAVAAGSGRIQVPPVPISGLQRGFTYHYRVIASNAIGTTVSADATFKAAEAPLVSNLNSRNLQATSAELVGEINPRYGATTYHFEWGPTAAYGNVSPAPDGNAGSGTSGVSVNTELEGLAAGVTYHFRLVATNQYGTTTSPDQTFGFYPANCPNAQLRQETRSNSLPDCRAYELVTPSFAQGTFIYPERGPSTPLATSPSRLAYGGAYGTFSEETGDPSNVLTDLYASTRSDTGWFQKFIGKPATETFMNGGPPASHIDNFLQPQIGQYLFVGAQTSPDLSKVITYDLGWPSNNFGQQSKSASNSPYVWESSTGRLLERWPSNLSQVTNGERFVGWPRASTDLSHFVFQSNLPFAPGGSEVAREIDCCSNNSWGGLPPASIYDNNLKTGKVDLASIKGDNTTTFEGYVFDISEDGSQILMSEERASPPEAYTVAEYFRDVTGPLYLRANDEHTYEIASGRKITYVGSSGSGKTVYLRSAEQLTPDDHDTSTDLYVWQESTEQLTRVSTGNWGESGDNDACNASWNGGGCNIEAIERNGKGNEVSDSAIAAANGDLYFISPEQLLEGKGQEGVANLYLYRDGSVRFVASLNAETSSITRIEVSPNGDHMAFVTRANATGYNSAGHTEMYTYEPGSGRLSCASCRPDGLPPTSDAAASKDGLFQAYDGRVFFTTDDALVPRDTNSVQDVYEFTEGRAQLITTGVGPVFGGFDYGASTGFVGVSANGTDVYFATVDSLVTQDHNGSSLKIYDARTGGGFPAELTPEKCTAADECHGAGAAPPALPPDRTSANLGNRAKPKAHKARKHRKKKAKKKASAPSKNGKQRRAHRG
jgi:hypothetical protein